MSRKLISAEFSRPDGRWESPEGPILVEIKKTNSTRDVRDAFLALAYRLHDESPASRAVCVLVDSRLSLARLQDELARFRGVIHPRFADRVDVLLGTASTSRAELAFTGSLRGAPEQFHGWLRERLSRERASAPSAALPARQMVIAALALHRLAHLPPVSVRRLREIAQVSYPTVAAVLKSLADKGWLKDSDERGVSLRPLTGEEWVELAREHARHRKVHLFTDPTGHASPDRLAQRLLRLRDADKLPQHVRIGGILGAARHFPALDITAPPRLDLSVEAEPYRIAHLLDAALVPKSRPEQHAVLAVHVTRAPELTSSHEPAGSSAWASELECLADLIEMKFMREAAEMAHHLESAAKASEAAE